MNNDEELISIIEGMLFINGDEGLDFNLIKQTLNIPILKIKKLLETLNYKYINNNHGIKITFYAKTKVRITTLPKYYEYFISMKNNNKKKKLSLSNLEVLSIIAYKGPIIKMEIEKIRGVNSDYIINKLKDLELVKECGKRDDLAGRPTLFKVTDNFMKEFNLETLDQLPKIDLELNPETDEDLFN